MKKFLSILFVMIMCVPLCLAGCGAQSKENRKFNALLTHFNDFVTNTDSIHGDDISAEVNSTTMQVLRLAFDKGALLDDVISTNAKYTFIDSLYTAVLDDALDFVYNYAYICMPINMSISKSENNKLYSIFDDFCDSAVALASAYDDLEQGLEMSCVGGVPNADNIICTSRLRNLYERYEQTISLACDLSNQLSAIYFSKVSNLDFVNKDFSLNATLNLCAHAMRSKAVYFKMLYTNVFFKANIQNSGLASAIVAGDVSDVSDLDDLSAFEPWDFLANLDLDFDFDNVSMNANYAMLKKSTLAFLENEDFFINKFNEFDKNIQRINYFDIKQNEYLYQTHDVRVAENIDLFIGQYYNDNYKLLKNILEIIY